MIGNLIVKILHLRIAGELIITCHPNKKVDQITKRKQARAHKPPLRMAASAALIFGNQRIRKCLCTYLAETN